MRYIFCVFLLSLSCCICAYCQEHRNTVPKDSTVTELPGNVPMAPEQQSYVQPIVDIDPLIPVVQQSAIDSRATDVYAATHFNPYLLSWKGGGLTGYNGMSVGINGYGYRAGLVGIQQWGNLSLTAGANLSKDMINAVGVVNGVGGNAQLSYRLSRNVLLTAFGGIHNYGMMGPAPNMTSAYYGGYATFLTNNAKWGMDVGVRQVYNSMTGRWETVPIVMPYYNLGGSKLGFDFGGLLYSAFNSASESVNGHPQENHQRGPAIIPPPIDTRPKKLPTEMPRSMGNPNLK